MNGQNRKDETILITLKINVTMSIETATILKKQSKIVNGKTVMIILSSYWFFLFGFPAVSATGCSFYLIALPFFFTLDVSLLPARYFLRQNQFDGKEDNQMEDGTCHSRKLINVREN